MGSGAEPSEIANLFSETLEWDIAGDTGALPWIGHKSGQSRHHRFRSRFAGHDRANSAFEVHDILASGNRAAILGSLTSKLKRNGNVVTTDFANRAHRRQWCDCQVSDVGRQLRCFPNGTRLIYQS